MKPGSLLSNIGWLGTAGLLSKPIWFVFILYTARSLGSEDFGAFAYLLVLSGFVTAFCELGLDLHITRVVSPSKNDITAAISTSATLRLLSGVLALLLGWILFILTFRDTYSPSVYIPGFLIGTVLFLLAHLRVLFRSLEVLRQEALSVVMEKLLVPAVTLPALLGSKGLESFLNLHLLGVSLVLLAGLIQLRASGLGTYRLPTLSNMSEMVKGSLPFAVMNLIQIIYVRLATLFLERSGASLSAIGFLNAGARIQEAFAMIPNTLMGAVYPILCRIQNRRSTFTELVDLSSRILLATAMPVGATLLLAGEDVTVVLFGEAFREAAPAVGFFGGTILFSSQVYLFGSIVSSTGLQPRLNRLLGTSFLLSLMVYLVLSERFSVEIAALLTMVDQALLLLINAWTARAHYHVGRYLGLLSRAALVPSILFILMVADSTLTGHLPLAGWLTDIGGTTGERLLRMLSILLLTFLGILLTGVARWKDLLRLQRLSNTLQEVR